MAMLALLAMLPVAAHAQAPLVPVVHAPYNAPGHEAAVFWFGRVTSQENYADVRLGYFDDRLYVHLSIIDRRLWFDTTPSPTDLTDWDAISLYLSADPTSPLEGSHRFDAQFSFPGDRAAYQAAYRWQAGAWSPAAVAFETVTGLSGDPNTSRDGRGWTIVTYVPFASLGLDGPPAPGTLWRIGLVLHDRDDSAGTPLAKQVWPTGMSSTNPATWAELSFGAPPAYTPPDANPGGVVTIRHGQNGATVVDAHVGGSVVCGGIPDWELFARWGELNYSGEPFLNAQNLGHISEWPCFSKVYITFPLDALPQDKVMLTAELTMYQFGNAGAYENPSDPQPEPSLIQVATVDQGWEETSITWNNAPPAVENITTLRVDPLEPSPPWPGIPIGPGVPRVWDVSSAVAEAYADNKPVQLALYSPSWEFHSGKYFRSSDFLDIPGRPTLTVTWGEPAAQIAKEADRAGADRGEAVAYTLGFHGTGDALVMTDTLPSGVDWVGDLAASGTAAQPVYDAGSRRITWQGSPTQGQPVEITYSVLVSVWGQERLTNTAQLSDGQGSSSVASMTVLANPNRCFLPLVMRQR